MYEYPAKPTYKLLQAHVRQTDGFTVKRVEGEIRLALKGPNSEPSAYYTESVIDALDTLAVWSASRTEVN